MYSPLPCQLESVGECYFSFHPFFIPAPHPCFFFADLRKEVPKCRWAKRGVVQKTEKKTSKPGKQSKVWEGGRVCHITHIHTHEHVSECWYIKWNEILLSETMKLLKKICKLYLRHFLHKHTHECARMCWEGRSFLSQFCGISPQDGKPHNIV